MSYPTCFRTAPLSGHVGSINSLVYSPDGTHIATGNVDGMVKLWGAATGRELLTLTRQTAEVKDVAFSPDARRLEAVTVDGIACVYLVRLQDVMALAQARVTRALTTEECQEYLHIEHCLAAPW